MGGENGASLVADLAVVDERVENGDVADPSRAYAPTRDAERPFAGFFHGHAITMAQRVDQRTGLRIVSLDAHIHIIVHAHVVDRISFDDFNFPVCIGAHALDDALSEWQRIVVHCQSFDGNVAAIFQFEHRCVCKADEGHAGAINDRIAHPIQGQENFVFLDKPVSAGWNRDFFGSFYHFGENQLTRVYRGAHVL